MVMTWYLALSLSMQLQNTGITLLSSLVPISTEKYIFNPRTKYNGYNANARPMQETRTPPSQMPLMVKLIRLPTVNPPTRQVPMKPPAASRSPSPTHSPAAIMPLEPSHPLVRPNGN